MRDQLYINGEWVSPDLGGYLEVIDPATEQVLQQVARGTGRRYRPWRAARRAFEQGWGQSRGAERALWLEALADELQAGQDELAILEVRDNGKPLPEAQWDIADAIGCFRYYAGLARELERAAHAADVAGCALLPDSPRADWRGRADHLELSAADGCSGRLLRHWRPARRWCSNPPS